MEDKLNILILEDVALDAELIEYEMRREKINFNSQIVETEEDFTNSLKNFNPDVVLADHSLPTFDGLSALKITKKLAPDTPFIFVSGKIGEEFAVEVLKEGATDYVLKNNLSKLVPALQRAINEAKEQSELKNVESTLKRRNEQMRLITDNMLDIVINIDSSGTIQYLSPSIKTVLGLNFDAILNHKITELKKFVHPDDIILVTKGFKEVFNNNSRIIEYRCQNSKGEYIWLEAIGNLLYNNSNKSKSAVFVIRNINDRKIAESKLKEYHNQLERMVADRTAELESINKELESFSYSVSHDLRAPLRRIDGYSLALLEDYSDKLDEQGIYYLNRLRISSQRMAQLIDDLLELSKLTRSNIKIEDVNLSLIVSDIFEEFKTSDPNRNVNYTIKDNLVVKGDSRLLKIMMENLLDNAWKFTGNKKAAIINFGSQNNNGQLTYFIKDNGTGFNRDQAEKIFKPFQRLNSENQFPGSGIGLATVQRIVHKHGGNIWAHGDPDNGATFFFTLNPKGDESE
ncbi:MAG: ATP-binding protein [Methanomicrobiales archaeon]